MIDQLTVRAPATTANMGPGFDSLGMALDLWNEATIALGEPSISIDGEGAAELPRNESNSVVQGIHAAFREAGKEAPSLTVQCNNEVPLRRGFGSSAAATVAGLMAGLALAGCDPDPARLLDLVASIEGHPDNSAAAIYGGCCISVLGKEGWVVDQVPLPENLHAVAFVPDLRTSTTEARAILPRQVSREDAVFNLSRTALLVNALGNGRLDLLREATEDRLHQPRRGEAFPAMKTIIRAALNGGAHGAFLSGSGPSVIALTTGREVTVLYEMTEAARRLQQPGRGMVLRPSPSGACIL